MTPIFSVQITLRAQHRKGWQKWRSACTFSMQPQHTTNTITDPP